MSAIKHTNVCYEDGDYVVHNETTGYSIQLVVPQLSAVSAKARCTSVVCGGLMLAHKLFSLSDEANMTCNHPLRCDGHHKLSDFGGEFARLNWLIPPFPKRPRSPMGRPLSDHK